MALSSTKTTVINSTATASSYTGSFTTGSTSDYLLIWIAGYKSTSTDTPGTGLTVTLGGVTAVLERDSNATNVGDWVGVWKVAAPPSGTNTLTVSGIGFRSLSAVIEEISGHDTTTPIAGSGQARSSGNQANISFNRTTTANNNMLSSGMINRCVNADVPTTVAAEISTTGGATMFPAAAAATGGVTANDHIFACASEIVATAGADGHGYTWTTAGRPDLVWVEINAATGGPTYTLTAQVGVFALVGKNANLIYSGDPTYRLTAVAASFVLSGKAVTLTWSGGGVSQALAITAMPFDGYVFDSADGANAIVTIKGVGTTGDSIQVRGESGGGNTSYSGGATVDGAGNWMATLTVPLAQWGNWYTPAARIGTNDATKVTSANTFGCGHVVGLFGQSELEYTMNVGSFYSNSVTMPTLSAANLTMVTQASGGGIATRRVTSAVVGQVNVAMVALANALNYSRPNRKYMICDFAEVGTGRAQLMADANTGRNWSDLQTMIDLIRSGGSEVGHWLECWYNNDASSLGQFALEWSPFYMGQRWGGGSFTLGTANPDSSQNPGALVDHCLWDVTAASNAKGRGVFTRDRTKYHMLTPMPFTDAATSVEQTNFSTGGGARIADLDRPTRDGLLAFWSDSRVQTFAGSWGPSMHICDYGSGIHPREDSIWGIAQQGRNYLPTFLRLSGYSVGEPTIIGTEAASDGSYADIIVDLPNGGNLTTIRAINSIAAPGTEPPHYQPVVGVEIRRAADSDTARRPVFKTSETTYPVNYRGTVTIADAGTGTPPSRRGRIRVTPTTPFVAGDRLEFLRGEASAMLLEARDAAAQLPLDMPIEYVPALYDAAATYPFQGVPVRPQPALLTLSMPTYRLTAQVVPFVLSGKAAVLSMNRRLMATTASFVLTGRAATLTYVPAGTSLLIGSFPGTPGGGQIIGGGIV